MIIKNLKRIIFFTSFAFAISFSLFGFVFFETISRHSNTEVIFLDVGQGDSILIKTRYGQNILIDGGKDSRVLDRIGTHLPFFDRHIDIVIATHPDSDHIGGLVSVLERYDVGVVLDSGVLHPSEVRKAMMEIIGRKDIPIDYVASRRIYEFGNGTFLDVLYPLSSFVNQNITDNNLASITAKLTDGEIDFIFTGDAPEEIEKELVSIFGEYLSSEVLKAGHHGSKSSSSQDFLLAVNPEVVAISVGEGNNYGHPDARVMQSFSQIGAYVLRTDKDGDIRIVSDGEFFRLK